MWLLLISARFQLICIFSGDLYHSWQLRLPSEWKKRFRGSIICINWIVISDKSSFLEANTVWLRQVRCEWGLMVSRSFCGERKMAGWLDSLLVTLILKNIQIYNTRHNRNTLRRSVPYHTNPPTIPTHPWIVFANRTLHNTFHLPPSSNTLRESFE